MVVPSYTDLKAGSSKVNMILRNLSSRIIKVKAKSIVAQVATANVVAAILVTNKFSGIRRMDRQKYRILQSVF